MKKSALLRHVVEAKLDHRVDEWVLSDPEDGGPILDGLNRTTDYLRFGSREEAVAAARAREYEILFEE